jgi:anionic glutamate receptor
MDHQACPIRLASYGYTTKDMVMQWREKEPIQMNLDFNMPQFRLVSFRTGTCISITASGNFSCIELLLSFKRAFGFYLIQIYIPCGMLVIVSWVSFWLEPTAVEARVSLGVTTILTIVTQTYGINQSVPPASYVKALDIFTAMCQAMVFGGLLQFALVNYVTRGHRPPSSTFPIEAREAGEDEEKRVKAERLLIEKRIQKAKFIDRISRVAFPAIFCLFNVTYWSSYFPFLDTFLPKYHYQG